MTETTTTAVDSVIGIIPKLFELAGDCFDAIIANPVLLVFFSVGMIGVGLGVFKMLKRTARG